MKAFEFCCPTKIIAGAHALDKLPGELADRGVAHPLVMTDAGLVKLGVAAKLTDVLDAAGVAYDVFDQVPPDSSMDVVNEVARLYAARGCDGFVAIGGGSVIDTTKGAAASLACEGVDFATLQGSEILHADLPPFIAVPTTAGTGSEVTCWATIWDPEQNCKRSLESQENYAYAALVDPELAQGMPVQLAVSSALDAAAHAVESYWANHTNAVSRGLALEAIATVMGGIDGLLENAPAAHEAMARGSLLAGLAFSNTKTTACHSISYPLTMRYHIPHGTAVALLLAPVLELNAPAVPGLDRLFHALGVEDAAGLHARVRDLLERSGQPATLQGWGVKMEELPRLAALGMTKGRADNNPTALDSITIEKLLRSIYQ